MKRSHGPAALTVDADLLLKVASVVRFGASASQEAHIRVMLASQMTQWRNNGKVLEKDRNARLQPNVQELADRYLPRTKRGDVSG